MVYAAGGHPARFIFIRLSRGMRFTPIAGVLLFQFPGGLTRLVVMHVFHMGISATPSAPIII